jgi:membrane-associated phospholipid phosphatase
VGDVISEADGFRFSAGQERAVLLGGGIALYGIYFPLIHLTKGMRGHEPTLAIDEAMPLWPEWLFVYAMVYFAAILPAFVVRHRSLVRRMAAAYAILITFSLISFVVIPVHMALRPASVEITSFVSWGLALVYAMDPPSNCFPSLHVGATSLAALCTWKADRVLGTVAAMVAGLIGLSTMLVKQHYVVDVMGGFLLAGLAYWICVHRFQTGGHRPLELRFPRPLALFVPALYLAGVLGLWILYQSGWVPGR